VSLKDRLDKIFDVSSYGYVVNKWLFRSAFILMVFFFMVVVRVDGWDVAVHGGQGIVCPDGEVRCLNPYVAPVCPDSSSDFEIVDFSLCEPVYLRGGESWGVIPSGWARAFPYLCVGLFSLSLLLNHLMYNKNFKVIKSE
jgi:hypothetical protein